MCALTETSDGEMEASMAGSVTSKEDRHCSVRYLLLLEELPGGHEVIVSYRSELERSILDTVSSRP